MTANPLSSELLALAAKVEALTGPDRGIDALIAIALDPDRQIIVGTEPGRFPQKAIFGPVTDLIEMAETNGKDAADYLSAPSYTASIDSAMTLVPEGWPVRQMSFSAPCADDRKWHINLHGGTVGEDTFVGRGATKALALTAASLRAIAAQQGEGS